MRINLAWTVVLVLFPAMVQAQTVIWTDGSGGKATTEIKVLSEDPTKTFTAPAGTTTLSLVDTIKAMTSPWFCVQARHLYPNGSVSGWYLSDTEGICKLKSQFQPPPVIEPPPIVVVPPPIVPPPPVEPPPPTEPGVTKSELATLLAAQDAALTAKLTEAIKANNKAVINGINACVAGSGKSVSKSCLTTLRDTLSK